MFQIFENQIEIILRYLMFIVVILSSSFIYYKANKLYELSTYKGLRILSLSFLFFGLAYLGNFFISIFDIFYNQLDYLYFIYIMHFLFNYTITMAGVMLLYSLVWRDLENSIIRSKYIILNLFGIFIALLSMFKIQIMFIILLTLLLYGSIISYSNYKNKNKSHFSQLYFIIFILTFLGYLGNFLLGFFPLMQIYVYILTIIIFIIFLYGTFKFTN